MLLDMKNNIEFGKLIKEDADDSGGVFVPGHRFFSIEKSHEALLKMLSIIDSYENIDCTSLSLIKAFLEENDESKMLLAIGTERPEFVHVLIDSILKNKIYDCAGMMHVWLESQATQYYDLTRGYLLDVHPNTVCLLKTMEEKFNLVCSINGIESNGDKPVAL